MDAITKANLFVKDSLERDVFFSDFSAPAAARVKDQKRNVFYVQDMRYWDKEVAEKAQKEAIEQYNRTRWSLGGVFLPHSPSPRASAATDFLYLFDMDRLSPDERRTRSNTNWSFGIDYTTEVEAFGNEIVSRYGLVSDYGLTMSKVSFLNEIYMRALDALVRTNSEPYLIDIVEEVLEDDVFLAEIVEDIKNLDESVPLDDAINQRLADVPSHGEMMDNAGFSSGEYSMTVEEMFPIVMEEEIVDVFLVTDDTGRYEECEDEVQAEGYLNEIMFVATRKVNYLAEIFCVGAKHPEFRELVSRYEESTLYDASKVFTDTKGMMVDDFLEAIEDLPEPEHSDVIRGNRRITSTILETTVGSLYVKALRDKETELANDLFSTEISVVPLEMAAHMVDCDQVVKDSLTDLIRWCRS